MDFTRMTIAETIVPRIEHGWGLPFTCNDA